MLLDITGDAQVIGDLIVDGNLKVTGALTVGGIITEGGQLPPPAPSGSPVPGASFNMFAHNLFNDQGVIKHWFANPASGGAPALFAPAVNAPRQITEGAIPIPTGPDGTTPFQGGAKLINDDGAPSNNFSVVFDTADMSDRANWVVVMSLSINTTNVPLVVRPGLRTMNVNGVTRDYLIASYYTLGMSGGQPVGYNLFNLPPGTQVSLQVSGYLKDYAA